MNEPEKMKLPRYITMGRKELIEFCLNENCYKCKCNEQCGGIYIKCENCKREYLNEQIIVKNK